MIMTGIILELPLEECYSVLQELFPMYADEND